MDNGIIKGVKGFDDVFDENYSIKSRIADILLDQFMNWGYIRIEAPLFESTELFLRKSGGELASRLYRLKDSSVGDVSVRPEFTSSVIRSLIANGLDNKLPRRVAYSGPVYRRPLSNRVDETETMQLGVEFLGSKGLLGDSEIISMVLGSLKILGMEKAILKLNSLDVLFNLLDSFRLSERSRIFIMANLEELKKEPVKSSIEELWQKAEKEGLVLRESGYFNSQINEATDDVGKSIKTQLSDMADIWIGRRDASEVEKRYVDKFDNDQEPKAFSEALKFMAEFVKLTGTGRDVLTEAEIILDNHGLQSSLLDNLKNIVEMVDMISTDNKIKLVWDMGFAHGLSYYSGLVFEVTTGSSNTPPICVGGRYDGLTRALGGADFPALGFAYSVDALLTALSPEQVKVIVSKNKKQNKPVVVQPLNFSDISSSIKWAEHLRQIDSDKIVILGGFLGDKNSAREYARSVNARELIFVDKEDKQSETLQKDTNV